ncbi:DNA-3-methyladenine glycosylase [Mariniblastus sp.]|nr:DNA-3-methyladenine glycosylase [Mariniblastus sp.]
MKKIIKLVGPFTAKTNANRFDVLVNSIVGQQISTAAATTIKGRLLEYLNDGKNKYCLDKLKRQSAESLKEVGVSRQKATYLLDLADKVDSGVVDLKKIGRKDNEAVIAELTQIKGVGVWTAQMFLIFSMGRLNVFPSGDLGIKNGIQRFYGLQDRPTEEQMQSIAEPWAPYESMASWYLWQGLSG